MPPTAERLDLSGYLLLAAPAELHAHFDTALTADRIPNPTGDLAGAVQAWLDYQGSVPRDDFVRRATEAALLRAAMEMGADVVGGCPHLEPRSDTTTSPCR